MPVALGILTALISLAVIAYPFIRKTGATRLALREDEIERLTRLQTDLYAHINQLQTDHAANSVSDDDYRMQLRELRIDAAETIRALDELGVEEQAADAPALLTRESLEQEIAALRLARSRDGAEVGD